MGFGFRAYGVGFGLRVSTLDPESETLSCQLTLSGSFSKYSSHGSHKEH